MTSADSSEVVVLTDALLSDGRRVDLVIEDGVVVRHIEPEGAPDGVGKQEEYEKNLRVESLAGMLALPAPVEPHAHLDKALSANRVKNPAGDLAGAIHAWLKERNRISHEDFIERANKALELAITNGTTAVRTHIDVGGDIGVRAIEALVEARENWQELIELQIVALASSPITGKDGKENLRALESAMEKGADLVGAVPALDTEPDKCIALCLELAIEVGVGMDLHVDETLDVETLTIRELCKQVKNTGFKHDVTASHCVSLGVQSPADQQAIAGEIRDAGINVVTLPQTNLYLQARDIFESPPRGLTALFALEEAGVTVAAGGDNLQDPFNLMGRGDPLETASLLVTAGHLSPEVAFASVTNTARHIMGLNPVGPEVGQVADLLCISAVDVREAVALAPADRRVYKGGKLVAEAIETRRLNLTN